MIKETSKNSLVPEILKDKWKFTDTVENPDGTSEPVEVWPTWVEAATRLKSLFGDIRNITVGGIDYIIVEFELSFVHGEIDSVIALQSPDDDLNFNILTNSEAIAMLENNS